MKRAIFVIAFLALCGCKSKQKETKIVEIPLHKKLVLKADSMVIKASTTENMAQKYSYDKYAYKTYKKAIVEAREQASSELKSKYVNSILTRVVNMMEVTSEFGGAEQEIGLLLKECKSFIDEGSIDNKTIRRYETLKKGSQE